MKYPLLRPVAFRWLLCYCIVAILGMQSLGLLHRQVHDLHGHVAHLQGDHEWQEHGRETLFGSHEKEACAQFDRLACGDGCAINTAIAKLQPQDSVLQAIASKGVAAPRVVHIWPRGPPELS